MNQYIPNAYAPVGYAGINDASPEGYVDRKGDYFYDIALTANQALVGEQVNIDTDADFIWMGLVIVSEGNFNVRFYDASNYALSNAMTASGLYSIYGAQPSPINPVLPFPAGSKITLDITDTSGSSNTGQIMFVGMKRYRFGNIR